MKISHRTMLLMAHKRKFGGKVSADMSGKPLFLTELEGEMVAPVAPEKKIMGNNWHYSK